MKLVYFVWLSTADRIALATKAVTYYWKTQFLEPDCDKKITFLLALWRFLGYKIDSIQFCINICRTKT